ncbi:MAG: AAA family ATPase [Bdellovibrionales bacterium]|nr:AAA family ATPase [Bdellovibrionales bacterium]
MKSILSKRKILITAGTGGVGKTTLSASMGIRAAIEGRKVCVITIDPAKRLATSLGIDALGNEPTDLTHKLREALTAQGIQLPETASFSALMPDTRTTFESFLKSLTQNPATAETLFKNPLFQIFAREFSGANEYMAMQKLQFIHESGNYDCIILDTPPSRSTLEFLDAPKLLSQLFEANYIQWLIVPANKLASSAMRKVLGLLEKLMGAGFMGYMMEFVTVLFEVRAGFMDHLRRMIQLMESEEVGVVLVTGAHCDFSEELAHFRAHLEKHGLKLDGMVVNRTIGAYRDEGPQSPPPHESEFVSAVELLRNLKAREERGLRNLKKTVAGDSIDPQLMPELARDVHDFKDLVHIARRLDQCFG